MPNRGGPEDIFLRLTLPQYRHVLCALESVVTQMPLSEEFRKQVLETWLRLLLEGGHIDMKEMLELKKKAEKI